MNEVTGISEPASEVEDLIADLTGYRHKCQVNDGLLGQVAPSRTE